MSLVQNISNEYSQLQTVDESSLLSVLRHKAFNDYSRMGIPTARNEEWKYTRLNTLAGKDFHIINNVKQIQVDDYKLANAEAAAELYFINGTFSEELSVVHSDMLELLTLDKAAEVYSHYIQQHLDHSSKYIKDGMNALNTAFTGKGLFVKVTRNKALNKPIYIYHITDTTANNIFAQPRSLFVIEENAQAQIVEIYKSKGTQESFTNEVIEIAVYDNARLEYYKVQNETPQCHHVGTTHIQQVGKCFTHCVTATLNGGTIRNNINMILEAAHNEGHFYGLYMVNGNTHVDNHSIVDNVAPDCYSNELYKGILDGNATGVFNGKIYVRQDAQKTNAYQSNKNVLLSDTASVNTKPQLEIFADDVKCSHGCTIGQLDEEALFYLRARGIGEQKAKAMLVHAFAGDILAQIKIEPLKTYLEEEINNRLDV